MAPGVLQGPPLVWCWTRLDKEHLPAMVDEPGDAPPGSGVGAVDVGSDVETAAAEPRVEPDESHWNLEPE